MPHLFFFCSSANHFFDLPSFTFDSLAAESFDFLQNLLRARFAPPSRFISPSISAIERFNTFQNKMFDNTPLSRQNPKNRFVSAIISLVAPLWFFSFLLIPPIRFGPEWTPGLLYFSL